MRKLFKLVGEVTLEGMAAVNKGLISIDKEAKKTERTIAKFGKNMSAVGADMTKFITGPIVALGAGMVMLANKTGQYADSLLDLRDITGLSTDTLQEMENVSREAGVSFDGLMNTISKLTNQIPEISKGTGPAAEAIQKLGVNIYDAQGHVRDMNSLFPDLLDKLRDVENVTERNALAQDIFGRSLTDIGPVLGLTTEQFEAARKEAHELGLVMSEDALNAANEYRIATEKLKAQITAAFREIADKFLPIIRDDIMPLIKDSVIPAMQGFADKVRGVIDWFQKLPDPVKKTAIQLTAILAIAGPLMLGIGQLITITKTLTTAILLLNAGLLANPFVLAAAAVGLLTAAIIATDNAWTDWNKNIGKNVAEKQARAVKDTIEELIPLYNELALMDRQEIGEEKFAEVSARVKELETNLGDAGIAFEGSFNRRAQEAENYLTDLAFTGKEAASSIADLTEETKQQTEAEKQAAKERAKIREQEAKERADFSAQWESKYNAQVDTAEVALEREYQAAIAQADKMGADKSSIEKYYANERSMLFNQRADEERERLEEDKEIFERNEEEKQSALRETAGKAREYAQQTADNIIAMFSYAGNAISGIFSGVSQNQSISLDNEMTRRREAIEQSIMGEEEKNAALAKLDIEAEKRKRALMRKQAQQEKASAIFSAVINVAQGVTKAIAQGGIAGAVFGAIVAALGAVQIGVIAARPLPLAKGAMVKGGRGGVTAEVGEGSDDEIVFPLRTGIQTMVDMLVEKLRNIEMPGLSFPQPAFAGAGGGGNVVHMNFAGSLIADDYSIKELERRMRNARLREDQRRGI